MSPRECNFEKCKCQRRILVVDNNEIDRNDHIEDLTLWGFEPVVAEGDGEALLDDARRKARELRCHAALLDLRLRDDHDQSDESGLDLVSALKPARAIIVTGYGTVKLGREATSKHKAFACFAKEERPEDLHALINSAVQAFCHQELEITPQTFISDRIVSRLKVRAGERPIQPDELSDILATMFPEAHRIHLEELSHTAQTSGRQSMAARRRSVVVRAVVDDRQPLVIKFAAERKIEREVTNYNEYVEGRVGGASHAQLERHKSLWNAGGIAYKFIGDTSDEIIFSTYFREQPSEAIVRPLQHFFTVVWGNQYMRSVGELRESLFDSYDTLWGHTLSEKLAYWRYQDKYRTFHGLGGEFLEPRSWVAHKKDESRLPNLRQSIIHGDFHGDNLFADKNGNSWVIDFERTGKGHILVDFIELEQDILARLTSPDEVDLPLFYELVIATSAPMTPDKLLHPTQRIRNNSEARKTFYVIQELRKLAYSQCRYKDNREYYWALLLDALFVSTVLDQDRDKELWQRVMLMASILCSRLDRWGEQEWPPKEWVPVRWVHV